MLSVKTVTEGDEQDKQFKGSQRSQKERGRTSSCRKFLKLHHQTITFLSSADNQLNKASIYWVKCSEKEARYRVLSSLIPKYPASFLQEEDRAIAGINAGGRFLADIYNVDPLDYAYNLHIENGNLISLPVQTRSAIMEKDGKLHVLFLEAKGKIFLGKTVVNWVGSLTGRKYSQSTAAVFGSINQRLIRVRQDDGTYKRTLDDDYSFVAAYPNRLNVVFTLGNGKLKVKKITKRCVNIFEGVFILSIEKNIAEGIKVGDTVDYWDIDGQLTPENTDSAVSLGAVLISSGTPSAKKSKTYFNYMRVLYDVNGKAVYTGLHNQKARSAIIRTKDGQIIFLLVDSNPRSPHTKGMTLSDLKGYIINNWRNIDWAVACDGGQSSKLCLVNNRKISAYGNMHYEKWMGNMKIPDGFNGRPVTSMVIALET